MIVILTKHDLIPKGRKKKIEDIDLSDFIGYIFNNVIISSVVVFVKNKKFIPMKDRFGFGETKTIYDISELPNFLLKEENEVCSNS